MMLNEKTTIINLFAGPGAGKTTSSWQLAFELKSRGFVVEYVPEYAKELVWDGDSLLLNGTLESQKAILKEQNHRLQRLLGKVDFVVTDAPLLLNSVYLKRSDPEYCAAVVQLYRGFDNINVFVERDDSYVTQGRLQSQEESQALDQTIKDLLDNNGFSYLTCKRGHANELLPEILQAREQPINEEQQLSEDEPCL